jgi:transcription elongation GreA/GreB family factor
VKNLENVQGDERDVIFISTTFGKAPGTDIVRQNFGPISRPEGWRRLNVLFTRARKRLELFSSMSPEDIVVDEKTPQGTKALRNYLDFAKRGVLGTSILDEEGREPDSDFEISVANLLREKGYEVIPQFGVAGFFIDIVVRNPENRGELLAGIECDGASYHSGLSIRDRDRIRQEILESLGWKGRIWRIWSTDWFSDRRRAIKKLLDFLEQRRTVNREERKSENRAEEELREEVVKQKIETENGTQGLFEFSAIDDRFVEVGDEVTYCFDGKIEGKHRVRIVEGRSDPTLRLVNENMPLAQALLGLSAGEETELQIPGQPKRIVKLLKIQKPTAI